MENPRVSDSSSDPKPPNQTLNSLPSNSNFPFAGNDRRYAYSRQSSLQHFTDPRSPTVISNNFNSNNHSNPRFSRSISSIDIPPALHAGNESNYDFLKDSGKFLGVEEKLSLFEVVSSVFRVLRTGNRPMKRLFVLISLNVAYSTAELFIGLLSGRVGLVSDAFHLTFGCGLLTFSLFAMAISRRKPDRVYSYGYKRLEVLSAFTNALFLLFMSFSLAVEALHAFIQDESEHKHYLIISAVTNLVVNLVGVWFFRNYARINLAYRNAEDMNYHSVCLHVIADSIRSAGLVLASWLLALGIQNAEVLCLGLVSVTVFMLVMPLFKAAGGVLLQMAPPNVSSSAMSKCYRQIAALEDVSELSEVRLWELVPGHVVGSLSLQVKSGIDDKPVLQYVHGLYHELGVQDLTVEIDNV
ncbi:metal tolerance protein C2 [Silene latifolia]|uniref:metal tolerance protein C2 n=1 Tax=Silene latifolia TaxID=37657 RepID=UPI003D770510